MLPIQTVLDDLLVWVQLIEDCVGVSVMAGCENNDFEPFGHVLEEWDRIGPYIDADWEDSFFRFQLNLEIRVSVLIFHVVDKSFI